MRQLFTLVSHGVKVRLARGTSVKEAYAKRGRSTSCGWAGKQHCKTALIKWHPDEGDLDGDEYVCLVGSANWTVATGANHEASVVINSPSELFVKEWLEAYIQWWECGVSPAEVEQEIAQRKDQRRIQTIIDIENEAGKSGSTRSKSYSRKPVVEK